ncbi:MAG: molybdopterin dehydrogenase [Rhodospirillaceae bacterium]|mgnify:CR=1 FL=1|nr:molybdopterin dehydrogenase [Rhodospirillaceae bacterium]
MAAGPRGDPMKAPDFGYVRPSTLAECLATLNEYGDEAQVLAGGQSLMPLMNFRLAKPGILVDIGGLPELATTRWETDHVVIGALTTHDTIATSDTIREQIPLLSDAAPHVAHVAIRSRGTIGGSIALADPAAEWPACCLALSAEIELASLRGGRRVPADEFFLGLYSTDRQADELVTGIRFPMLDDRRAHTFDEVSRRRGDFAIAGLALSCDLVGPKFKDIRVALLGVGDRPVLARGAMSVLEDAEPSDATTETAIEALSAELRPPDDPMYPPDYRRQVACVLLRRALNKLMG